ncbi:MAG: hypothetical protein ACOYJD_06415 [Christensenellales bacterium]
MRKMNYLFWPVIIILIGVALLLKTIFKLDFSIFRIIIGVAIIWAGISVLSGGIAARKTQTFTPEDAGKPRQWDVVFASQRIDLSQWKPEDGSANVEINVVFGSAQVFVPRDEPLLIDGSSAFGAVRTPDGQTVAFGELNMKDGESPALYIKANCVFGELNIRYKD